MVDLWMILVFLAVLSFCWLYMQKSKGSPPGPVQLPIIGNLYMFWNNKDVAPADAFSTFQEKYGDIYMLKIGPIPMLILSSYDVIKDALVTRADMFSGRPQFVHSVQVIFGSHGVIFQDGESWKNLRRLTLRALRDFGLGKNITEENIIEETKYLLAAFEKTAETPYSDMKRLFGMATSNVLNALNFGCRFEYGDTKFQAVLNDLDRFIKLIGELQLHPAGVFPILKYLPGSQKAINELKGINERLTSFVKKHIDEHRTTFDRTQIRDFVDMYLKVKDEEGQIFDITEEDMLRTIIDLFLAGSETTATTLDWAVLYMMVFPEVQTRCQKEIDHVVGKDRLIRSADRKQLPYIDATVLEIMRFASIIPQGVPHATTEDVILRGYTIPKNTMVFPMLQSANHDPKYWECPGSFRPERFLDDQGVVQQHDALIPFSVGPRTCLGESLARTEMFIFFANCVQQYSFQKAGAGEILSLESVPAAARSPLPYKVIIKKR